MNTNWQKSIASVGQGRRQDTSHRETDGTIERKSGYFDFSEWSSEWMAFGAFEDTVDEMR